MFLRHKKVSDTFLVNWEAWAQKGVGHLFGILVLGCVKFVPSGRFANREAATGRFAAVAASRLKARFFSAVVIVTACSNRFLFSINTNKTVLLGVFLAPFGLFFQFAGCNTVDDGPQKANLSELVCVIAA